jgi:hypothetical protein
VSKEAQAWVSTLPLSATKTLVAFRVLDKLADAHHTDTDHAYRNIDKLAEELVCSVRHVQRALRELERLQLILVGDQSVLPRSVRPQYAPTAYRLPWRQQWEQPALLEPAEEAEVTPDVTPSSPVDNSSRGDRHAVPGVTHAVALGTQEQIELLPSATTDRARCEHEFSRRYGACVYCGLRRTA